MWLHGSSLQMAKFEPATPNTSQQGDSERTQERFVIGKRVIKDEKLSTEKSRQSSPLEQVASYMRPH